MALSSAVDLAGLFKTYDFGYSILKFFLPHDPTVRSFLFVSKSFLSTYSILCPRNHMLTEYGHLNIRDPRIKYNLEILVANDRMNEADIWIGILPEEYLPKAPKILKAVQSSYLWGLDLKINRYENFLLHGNSLDTSFEWQQGIPYTIVQNVADYRNKVATSKAKIEFKVLMREKTPIVVSRSIYMTLAYVVMLLILESPRNLRRDAALALFVVPFMLMVIAAILFLAESKKVNQVDKKKVYTRDDIQSELTFFRKLANDKKRNLHNKITAVCELTHTIPIRTC